MKPNLILLHGALGSNQQFEPLAKLLTPHFNLHSFSFDGHGNQAYSEDFSIDLFSKNLLHFIRQHQLQGAYCFGYSMGGYIALYLSKQQSGLLKSLVTLGTKFKWTPESAKLEAKGLNAKLIKEKVPHFAQTLDKRHQAFGWENVLQATAQMMLAMGNTPPLNENTLKQINLPCLLLVGDSDKMVSLQETELVSQQLTNSSMEILEQSPHPIEKVNLKALTQKLTAFFK